MLSPIGLLGGTFDPVHVGHLRAAIECLEHLHLERVDLLPAADPPLKPAPRVSAEHRLAMTRAAVTDIDGLAVDDRELRRTGTSFTVDTLAAWRNEYGETPSLVFIVGADVLPALPHWHDWQRLLDYCHLAVMARSNANQQLPTDVEHWLTRHAGTAQTVHQQAAGSVIHIAQPTLAVSSTQLRAALQHGRNLQFLLPQAVIEYIAQHDLYETGASPCDTP